MTWLEQTYEEVKRFLGVDPDQLVFDRIVRNDYAEVLREPDAQAYGLDMDLTTVPIPGTRELTAQDRCDRCGARALVVASFGEFELLFCVHHGTENRDQLEDKGWTVTVDEL